MLNRNNTRSGIVKENGKYKSYSTVGFKYGLHPYYAHYDFESILNHKVLIKKKISNDVLNKTNFDVRLNISGNNLIETAMNLCMMLSENAQ